MSDVRGSCVHVMVIEDHELLAESLRLALVSEGMSVTRPPLQVDEILSAATAENPQVVLLDLDLGGPNDLDGSLLVEPLAVGGARVVVVSGSLDRARIAACVESGAHGYIAKTRPLEDLLSAVRAAAAGQPVMSEPVRQGMLADLRKTRAERNREMAPFDSLTDRERFVLCQVMEGLSATEIATAAFVSEATVRTQIRAILNKLGVRSQLAAVAEARRVGWRYDASPTRQATEGH